MGVFKSAFYKVVSNSLLSWDELTETVLDEEIAINARLLNYISGRRCGTSCSHPKRHVMPSTSKSNPETCTLSGSGCRPKEETKVPSAM